MIGPQGLGFGLSVKSRDGQTEPEQLAAVGILRSGKHNEMWEAWGKISSPHLKEGRHAKDREENHAVGGEADQPELPLLQAALRPSPRGARISLTRNRTASTRNLQGQEGMSGRDFILGEVISLLRFALGHPWHVFPGFLFVEEAA